MGFLFYPLTVSAGSVTQLDTAVASYGWHTERPANGALLKVQIFYHRNRCCVKSSPPYIQLIQASLLLCPHGKYT